MAANTYQIGQRVQLAGAFSVDGTPTDPDTITLEIKGPSGIDVSYTYAGGQMTRSGVGSYVRNYTPAAAGAYRYRFTGTGACEAASVDYFNVADF